MQTISSKNTSLAKNLASLFKQVEKIAGWQSGTVNLDMGGGRTTEQVRYLQQQGVECHKYDPFNVDSATNRKTAEYARTHKFDTVTCTNVLNVVSDLKDRLNIILQCAKAVKKNGTVYFSVYEGNGTGVGKQTGKDQWQNNRKTADYAGEISAYFGKVVVRSKVIIATQPNFPASAVSVWNNDGKMQDVTLFGINQQTKNNSTMKATAKQLAALAKARKAKAAKAKKATAKRSLGAARKSSPRFSLSKYSARQLENALWTNKIIDWESFGKYAHDVITDAQMKKIAIQVWRDCNDIEKQFIRMTLGE